MEKCYLYEFEDLNTLKDKQALQAGPIYDSR